MAISLGIYPIFRQTQIGTTFRILNIALFVFDQEPRVLKRLARVHDFATWSMIPGLALRNLGIWFMNRIVFHSFFPFVLDGVLPHHFWYLLICSGIWRAKVRIEISAFRMNFDTSSFLVLRQRNTHFRFEQFILPTGIPRPISSENG
jgi:hypothetical protein